MLTKGKYLKLDETINSWIRTENKSADFLTLIRNVVLTKLALEGGFRIRNFISSSGEYIYSVLFQNMDNIKRFG